PEHGAAPGVHRVQPGEADEEGLREVPDVVLRRRVREQALRTGRRNHARVGHTTLEPEDDAGEARTGDGGGREALRLPGGTVQLRAVALAQGVLPAPAGGTAAPEPTSEEAEERAREC